ncbi:hypothetical protein EUGRSUZ_E01496 [Eucalyptus grandis]|uniref:Uncharacterized protein n=2 Tax=Eucalyptus grandis TaxID=71139 RepID=A0ACC3KUS2_EUCGR|nr:hypothetical protein EUGRSUZ_E01496 [Eucalyptus grandis]
MVVTGGVIPVINGGGPVIRDGGELSIKYESITCRNMYISIGAFWSVGCWLKNLCGLDSGGVFRKKTAP